MTVHVHFYFILGVVSGLIFASTHGMFATSYAFCFDDSVLFTVLSLFVNALK